MKNISSLIDVSEVARSIELYRLGKHLHELGKKGESMLVLTREPLLRARNDVKTLVVTAGSYDPLTIAHVALFQKGREVASNHAGSQGLDETMIITSTAHFEKEVDLRQNAAIYDRVHSLEGFASCEGSVSLGFFNKPLFLDMAAEIKKTYHNARIYFLSGVDVMQKVLNPEGYKKIGLNHEKSIEKLFEQSCFIVSQREMATPEGRRILTLMDLQSMYPDSRKYSDKMIPFDLQGDYTGLEIPVEKVSSTLIRTERNNHKNIDHLVAVGISQFVNKRSLYLKDSDKYAAFVHARQRFAEEHYREPLTRYIQGLMDYLEQLEKNPSLRAKEIALPLTGETRIIR